MNGPPFPIRLSTKIIAYLAAWLVAFAATTPAIKLWPLGWMFPLGLLSFFFPAALNTGGWTGLLACMGVYAVHAALYFRSRLRRSTFLLYAVLAFILFCNVQGCRRMIGSL